MQKDLLIIFARPPVGGKVKKRLAATLGQAAALRIYRKLLGQTFALAEQAGLPCKTYYAEQPPAHTEPPYALQQGHDLGERMLHAFRQELKLCERVCLIGSDCPYIRPEDLHAAFEALTNHEVVLGPASDGGYYLIALKQPLATLFTGIDWGTDRVLQQTLEVCHQQGYSYYLLDTYSDVDRPDDIPPGWL